MVIQWPLIIAGTFLAWAGGTACAQGVAALRGSGRRASVAGWVVTLVLLVIGGLGVLMRMQRLDRLFNSFTNLASATTQSLIALVVLAVVAVIALVVMARDGESRAPAVLSAAGVLVGAFLVVAAGRMLVLSSRAVVPIVLSVIAAAGMAAALGIVTVALVRVLLDRDARPWRWLPLTAVVANAVTTVVAVAGTHAMLAASSAATVAQYGFDPTRPTSAGANTAHAALFSGDVLPFTVSALAAAVVALVLAVMGSRRGAWRVWGSLAVLCVLASAVALRVALLSVGVSTISMR